MPPAPPRRSQAERREATRAALLDATIDSLIEHGYARLTTSTIVKRAGVTRGAHAHYFDSKADLMVQSLDRLSARLISETERQITESSGSLDAERILDQLWEVHCSDLFTAAIELLVASRTDRELQRHLRQFERNIAAHILRVVNEKLPTLVGTRGFAGMVITAMAAMRGIALQRYTGSSGAERTWLIVREELLEAFEQAQAHIT